MPKTKKENIAKVNNGFLIITLIESITPTVWRLELEKAKVAAFEIKPEKKTHSLTIKISSKSTETIGIFNNKEEALKALLSISNALGNIEPHKEERLENTPTKKQKIRPKERSNKTAILLIATCFVIGLFYYYWGRLIPTTQVFEAQSISSNANRDPASQTGIPVSADDLLKGF